MHGNFEYLEHKLDFLGEYFSRPNIIEVAINADGSVWLEEAGQAYMTQVTGSSLPANTAKDLASLIANENQISLSDASPLLSASVNYRDLSLRAQAVIPPASLGGHIISFRAFRHKSDGEPPKFKFIRKDVLKPLEEDRSERIQQALELARKGDEDELLKLIIREKMNVVVSGGTTTGKTTLGKRLLWHVPDEERLLTIEDSSELIPKQPNVVGLIASKDKGSARSADKLLQAALRLRPDRIILGEVRGDEAATFIEAINTGHSGSFTTLHADSARKALDRLAIMILKTGTRLEYENVIRYLTGSIDVILQSGREGDVRGIAEVFFPRDEVTTT